MKKIQNEGIVDNVLTHYSMLMLYNLNSQIIIFIFPIKITGIFFLVLVASTSAWPFSFWGSEDKKNEGEKSDVILNYDTGDHKHIQTGRAGEAVHGTFR